MQSRGPKDQNWTTVRFTEDAKTAHVWTASGPVYQQLKELGYVPVVDSETSAEFEIPRDCIFKVSKPTGTTFKRREKGGKRQ